MFWYVYFAIGFLFVEYTLFTKDKGGHGTFDDLTRAFKGSKIFAFSYASLCLIFWPVILIARIVVINHLKKHL